MILLAITAIVIIMLLIASAALYFDSRDDVDQIRETAVNIHNERVKEDVDVRINVDSDGKPGTSPAGLKLDDNSDAGPGARISGVMIKCTEGPKKGESFTEAIDPSLKGNARENAIAGAIGRLHGKCA